MHQFFSLQINIVMSHLRKDLKHRTAFQQGPVSAANHSDGQVSSPKTSEQMINTPSLFEPAFCFYIIFNRLFKWTLQTFDQRRHNNEIRHLQRLKVAVDINPEIKKSAIDSSKCIFILIKWNQIRSHNTSLALYWNWPAVQCTSNYVACCILLC